MADAHCIRKEIVIEAWPKTVWSLSNNTCADFVTNCISGLLYIVDEGWWSGWNASSL